MSKIETLNAAISDLSKALLALANNATFPAEVRVASRTVHGALASLPQVLAAKADPMTPAYLGYGFRSALDAGLEYDPDRFGGEEGFMQQILDCAPLLNAEWQRRYGDDGINPGGAPFIYAYEVVEPFAQQFATQLAADRSADPKPLIKELFDSADPKFGEPDIKAIRESLLDDALDSVATDESFAHDILKNGHKGLNEMSDAEVIALYKERFDDELPTIGDDSRDAATSHADADTEGA